MVISAIGNDMHGLRLYTFSAALLIGGAALAENASVDAALGGGVGGGLGAFIDNELAGRDGAIVGGALGAAVGTAVVIEDERQYRYAPPDDRRYSEGPPGRFCPPGHAKKGWCR